MATTMAPTAPKEHPANAPAWAELRLGSDVPPRVGVPADARLYWVGTLPSCPKQNLAVGGVSFPAFSEVLEDQGYVTQRHKRSGALTWLSPEQVERIKAGIEDRVVRCLTTGNPETGVPPLRAIYSRKGNAARRFAAFVGDEPLGRHLYMIDVDTAAKKIGPLWRDEAPPPLTA